MVEAPISTTRAVGLPEAKLLVVSSCIWARKVSYTDAARTPFLASQKAGQPQFSMAISMPFSRSLPAFQPVSVMSRGLSARGFSCSSTPSIAISSLGSLRPLEASGVGFVFVSRDVIVYSHRFAAVSQSSTVPSFDITLLMDILGNGVFIELSPKSCLACLDVDSDGMRP